MALINTSDLTGSALNWAVAMAENHEIDSLRGGAVWYWLKCSLTGELETVDLFSPETNWEQAGLIIAREKISVCYDHDRIFDIGEAIEPWIASKPFDVIPDMEYNEYGSTALIAAMRCYVSSAIGDTVDVPNDLA